MQDMRVLVYTDTELEVLVAQCVDVDICVQAKSLAETKRLLQAQFAFYRETCGMENVPAAPDFFAGEWDTTAGDPERLFVGQDQVDFKILPQNIEVKVKSLASAG